MGYKQLKQPAKTGERLLPSAKHRRLDATDVKKIAAGLRPEIESWIENGKSAGRKSEKPFIEELKKIYILRKHFPKQDEHQVKWREALELAVQQLEQKYPSVRDHVKTKWLDTKRNPGPEFLLSRSYKWLQHLEANPPKISPESTKSWFPKYAVEVTFEAFRMKGKLKTLENYVRAPSRRRTLSSILTGVATSVCAATNATNSVLQCWR